MTASNSFPRVGWLRALAATVLPPALTAVGAVALIRAWFAELPDPVAVHFGPGGAADGFGSTGAARWSPLIGLAFALGLCLLLLLLTRRDLRSARVGAAVGSGTGAFVAALPVALLAPQRGLADAAEASLSGWWMVLPVAAGLAAAAIGYAASPSPGPATAQRPPREDAPRIALADSEKVAWSGSAAMPPWLAAVVGVLPVAVVLGLVAFGSSSFVLVLVVAAVSAALMALVLAPVRVTVDATGLTARTPITGRPTRIPLDEIAEADVVAVGILNRFGGFGYRVGPDGTGLIVRPGPALRITRGDGSRFTVTVDGAEQAAAVLNALAAKGRTPR
ncbi:hypothetical protein ABIC28_003131 [Rhodococcus sp. PvR044]|jgi:hypothetical protein|uniref:DUF1648 domain-containing protein n=1 Tax=Rhodococcus TaxID=1827 RepID=UPI000BD8B25F|nr:MULTISPECIES: DUF1648 domain-containing protein [Rhodococcus]MBP1162369.1 hypothetical protein [Rhodococcus sp. PvR099]MCZ4555056.1 DUF1648 domain-containing protein [Rhodococcus maanshanensis]PTR45082.1 uncharacterized protein DUF1648 [Rhodococcus sp. OK611]SNX89417.1 Protein of unknown function [Rhodococcus sp. OK270]